MRERVELDIAAIEIYTQARVIERGYEAPNPYTLAYWFDDGIVHILDAPTLWKVRAIVAELKPEHIEVWCGADESRDDLLQLVMGRVGLQ